MFIFLLNKANITDFMAMSQVCHFAILSLKLVDIQHFFLNVARFTDFMATEQRRNVWACFCRSLHSDGKPHTIALKNRWQLQFSSKSVQTPILPFALLDNTTVTNIKCLIGATN